MAQPRTNANAKDRDSSERWQLAFSGGNIYMPNFDNKKSTWKVYVQVFKNKMKIHNIVEAEWPQYLLTFVAFEIVMLLTELCFTEEVRTKTFDQLSQLV